MNEQRKEVYDYRWEVLDSEEIKSLIEDMISQEMESLAAEFAQEKVLSADWDCAVDYRNHAGMGESGSAGSEL
jgi:preprotein translocase subunit SecA